MWSKPLAVPNGVKAGEAEQSGHEETSRTGTESEHEAHAQGRVPGRDGAGGAVARTHRVDRSDLAGSEDGESALCARDHAAHSFFEPVVRTVGRGHGRGPILDGAMTCLNWY